MGESEHARCNPRPLSAVFSGEAAQCVWLGEGLVVSSVRVWGPGVGAVVVLVATGAWARGTTGDTGLWDAVRPAIEARLVADARWDGPGAELSELRARWFCQAREVFLREDGDRVRAGVDTLCMEYGVRDGALQECGGAQVPKVIRLERDTAGAYRVVSLEEPPDGAGHGAWEKAHFGALAASRLDGNADTDALETAARDHFELSADAPVGDC